MNIKNILPAFALLTGVTGCALPVMKAMPADPVAVQPTTTPAYDRQDTARNQATLYARDGSVVGAREPGSMTVTQSTGQNSSAEGGSRWTLLEQYQSALSEKEQLEFELEAMASALDQAESREAQLAITVSSLRDSIAENTKRVETLEGHNVELAARLTTAQIRRLQSEKLLLEAKLDWRRIQAVINTPEAGSPLDATGSMPVDAAGPLGSTNE